MKKIYKLLLLFALLLLPLVVNADDTELKMTMLTSNGLLGDSILLESKGKYLLMDTFNAVSSSNPTNKPIETYLTEHNINSLSIYISHYHGDHYGGLIDLLNNQNINIEKIYLPKTEYLCEYHAIDQNESNPYFYLHYTNMNDRITLIKQKNIPVEFLWPKNEPYDQSKHCFDIEENSYSNKIVLGDATINIVGPVGTFTLEDFGDNSVAMNTKGNKLLNNVSLVSITKVGNTKIFSAGDIAEEEETKLLQSNIDLKCDIMKLSHHAVNVHSNTNDFVKRISPKYAIATNPGDKNPETLTYVNYVLYGDTNCTSNCYNGANVYLENYTGMTNFDIKNDVIKVKNSNLTNTVKVTLNYINKTTNEIFYSREYDYPKNTTIHLNDYTTNIDGYSFVESDNIKATDKITENKTYNIYMTKVATTVVDVPNTSVMLSFIIFIVGTMVIITGATIIYLTVRNKKEASS